jgi:hypothetical protein
MGTPSNYDYFKMGETPVDPRGGFKTNSYTEYCGLPWGGEFCVGETGTDAEETYDGYYESHYQA